jgi:glycerophosphoryl diester phosphodiesterase
MTHPNRLMCIGHRGARGHAPENTLLSIETGIRLGADMIEFDVQLCQDELVVIHDPRLERTTNGVGRVEHVRLDYLRSLDAGKGQQIPTLHEVLQFVNGRIPLNVEIKSADGTGARIAAALREAIHQCWRADHFLVSSFHLPELHEFKRAAPEIPVAALVCGVPLD